LRTSTGVSPSFDELDNLLALNSRQREKEEHVQQMQREILAEVDNLKYEVREGQSKIAQEE